jgi:hypothetical protein
MLAGMERLTATSSIAAHLALSSFENAKWRPNLKFSKSKFSVSIFLENNTHIPKDVIYMCVNFQVEIP